MNEIKTLEERENNLIVKGKEKGFITYEELAEELKGLEIDSDALDNLYNKLVENKVKIYEVKQEEKTLEDAFFEKTGGNIIE